MTRHSGRLQPPAPSSLADKAAAEALIPWSGLSQSNKSATLGTRRSDMRHLGVAADLLVGFQSSDASDWPACQYRSSKISRRGGPNPAPVLSRPP